MPYIEKNLRKYYDSKLDNLVIKGKGELEYCIYKLLKRYMVDKSYTYTYLHDAVYGAVHAAEEFKRRNLDIREDKALQENGDI